MVICQPPLTEFFSSYHWCWENSFVASGQRDRWSITLFRFWQNA